RVPPVPQRSRCVALASLIIETVADLVSYDGPDRTIVNSPIRGRIEEGWLQNTGRKDDLVPLHPIGCVHRVSGERPPCAIDRRSQLCKRILLLPSCRRHCVAEGVHW